MKIPSRRRGFTLVEMLVVIGLIVVLMGIATPVILNRLKEGNKIEAMNNGRQVESLLRDFSNKFGSFPDATTAANALERGYYTEGDKRYPRIAEPKSANDFLRQLNFLSTKGNPLESKIFYANMSDASGATTKKEENLNAQTPAILPPGTLGFAYVMRVDPEEENSLRGLRSDSSSSLPVLVTPVDGKGILKDFKFVAEGPLGGEAVVIQVGGQTSKKQILESGLVDGLFPKSVDEETRKNLRVAAPELVQ